MKKLFILITLLLIGNFVMADTNARYFMQSDNDIVSSIPYGNNEKAGNYVKSDDAKIYYEIYGKGAPILVLHGGQVGCTYEMGRFIDELSKNYQVIAVSTRGHGKSEIGHSPVTYNQRANDALAVLNEVTKKPAIVLGFSDGAYAAYKLASMYPDKVKKIIAIGAGENLDHMRKVPHNTVEDFKKADEKFVETQLAIMPEPDRWQEYLDNMNTFYNKDMIADKKLFMSIKCPVLVIAGELDPNAPLDTIITAYKMIPNAQLAIIPNAPHQVFVKNFDAVWASIVPFLKD